MFLSFVSLTFFQRSSRAQGLAVRLLLLRNGDYVNRCVECIPGKLYGVPDGIDLDSAEGVTALLTPICDTIELSYEENRENASSVPARTYEAFVVTKATKRWMWTGGNIDAGNVILDRAWRLELKDVPNHRTAIQFHYGKDVGWSRGCIIVGTSPANTCHDDCVHTDSPAAAVQALREYVESKMIASNTPIQIRIADG
jgi:hypothetical protein